MGSSKAGENRVALAVAAHPDDIEFVMAGTLLQLGRRGWTLHYLNLSSGHCGSMIDPPSKVRRIRRAEARDAARILGATWHPSLTDDLEILYTLPLLRRLAAVVRAVRPAIILTHSPQDYMEDHMSASRLAVSAAFVRGMPNFRCQPRKPAVAGDVAVYHALPHGLRDGLRRRVMPGAYVNTAPTHAQKRLALAAHVSQKAWLDATQGMDSYLVAMDDMSRAVGRLSRRFEHAEGWRRHLHLGLSAEDRDPLAEALGDDWRINRAYESGL